MGRFISELKRIWLWMFEPPWHHADGESTQIAHWASWLAGWAWALAGLILGAIVAPSLLQYAGLSNTSYQDWIVIAVALTAGIVVQLLGLTLDLILFILSEGIRRIGNFLLSFVPYGRQESIRQHRQDRLMKAMQARGVYYGSSYFINAVIAVVVPLAGVGYGIYRYFAWVGAGQREVTIAFVGALLVKTFLIPLIKGIVTGALFKWFMRWLRGDKAKPRGA